MKTKRKKFLGILLSLALVFGIMSGTSLTVYASHSHNNWDCGVDLPTIDGNHFYYLTDNVTLSSEWTVPKGITTLCLNGKKLTFSAHSRGIVVQSGSVLNLYDCSGEDKGTITGGAVGVTIEKDGTFNMYGGAISNNSAENGGGVYNKSEGEFNMHGGTIGWNSASYGGGVYNDYRGKFNMYGGTIIGNTAIGSGGGVENYGEFNMSGGEISSNETEYYNGGGVWSDGKFNLSEKPKITGNTKSGSVNNVYLAFEQQGEKIKIVRELTPGASVGVNMKEPGIFTKDYVFNKTYLSRDTYFDPYFSSDDNNYVVTFTSQGEAQLVDKNTITFDGDNTNNNNNNANNNNNNTNNNNNINDGSKNNPNNNERGNTERITISTRPASVKAKVRKKKNVTVSWKKIKKTKKTKALRKKIKSIQVQYADNKTFTNNVHSKKVGKTKTKVTFKLKRKKTYYVRVRYVGNDGYSRWSKVKKAKTK